MQRRRVRILGVSLGVAIVVALVLGYPGTRFRSALAAPTVERLSIALPTLPHAALLHIAAANGYFAEEGLDLAITPVTHGKAAIELLVQDKVDLAAAAEVPFVLAVMHGNPLGIATSVLSTSKDHAIVGRRDRNISAPQDLAGKRVGVTRGASGEYFLWAFLIRHKLPTDAVTLVDLLPGRLVSELEAGTIDAVAAWQPISADAQLALRANAVSFIEEHVYTETHVVIGHVGFLKAHPEAIERLVRALLRAETFNRAHPEEARALVAGVLKVDLRTLESIWKDFDFRVNLPQSQLITLEDEARWAMARGYTETGPVPNFLSALYLDALLAVRPERVTVIR